ncbi:MAG: sugar ABC transporter permease [Thermoclostridium sp.]|nr:sugar ABC transporter permease [Thermoclostridium sp.]
MRRKSVNYAKYGYLFSLPFVLAFLIFSLYPIIYTALIGFTNLKGLGKTDYQVLANPFQNYQAVISTVAFQKSLVNTLILWVVNFVPQILLALLLTAWFTNHRYKIKGQGAFKVLLYMPNIITAATIALLFNSLFGYPKGPANDLLMMLGLIETPIYFVMDKWTTRNIISFIQFWMWYGQTMIVFISGVLGINPELFEAAEIDGASGPQTFFRITLPSLKTIMLFTLVTSMIGGLQMFDIPRLFNLGNPDQSTLTVSMFIFNQAFSGSYLYNRASAASMILFAIIAVLSGILFYVMRDKEAIKVAKEKKARIKAWKAERRAAR